MREIETSIDINAPSTEVWRILMDFDHWKDWNPIVSQASGDTIPESKLSMTMTGVGGKDGPKYMPVVKNVEEAKSFRWRAKMMAGFLFTNDKVFKLEEIDSGTRLTHIEAYSGLMASLSWRKLNEHVPPMLESMNQALKNFAEKQH